MSTPRDDRARLEREERWRQLMRAAQDGDTAAYAALLSEILPVLRRFVAYRWPSAPDVEDIVQEVLLSVHTVRHTYDPARPFMPWLMTIAMRRTIDAARRRTARSANETTVDIMPETFSGNDTKNEQETSDDQEAIRRALAQLPDGQRQAVELMKVRGLSLQEASAVTGKSVASLKVSVHRGLKTMREVLKRETQ
ncbi:sigma-70 family RNA polymerase sigma factor [Methylocystis sp. H4A]|jgi:RNA polymerase sigma factor (sigma-70 family)|uniref:sigma-70 family RNA polymerase sigma factor n=1 Tax=Methylocystis sp. H4A TaxID=2785788 RepID=UPI001FED7104|nr:sigma-70 family RNA polymerase sigma factor [Methylocystis sp. H4A]